MAVQRAASSYSGVWSDPGNAYALSGDDAWATYTSTQRNGTHSDVFGFAGFSAAKIPDGSTIDSVRVVCEQHQSNLVTNSVIGLRIQTSAGTALGSETTSSATVDTVIASEATTIPSLQDLRDGAVAARLEYRRGNSPTSATARCDYVYLEVGFTPGTVVEALAGLSAGELHRQRHPRGVGPTGSRRGGDRGRDRRPGRDRRARRRIGSHECCSGTAGRIIALAGAAAATTIASATIGLSVPWPAPRPPAAAPVPTRGPRSRSRVCRWPAPTSSAALWATVALTGAVAGTASAVGSLAAPSSLAGVSAAWTTTSGVLSASVFLSGSSAATSTATARFASDDDFAGTSAATSSVTGTLSAAVPLSASTPASSAAAAAASRQRALTALAVARQPRPARCRPSCPSPAAPTRPPS